MGDVIYLEEKVNLSRVLNDKREKYFKILESIGIPRKTKTLECLKELMDPFLERLDDKYFSSGINLDNVGTLSMSGETFGDIDAYNVLHEMGFLVEGSLTREGYDMIEYYRKSKKLPSRREVEEEIKKENSEFVKNLGW